MIVALRDKVKSIPTREIESLFSRDIPKYNPPSSLPIEGE